MLASKVDALFQKVDDSNLSLPVVAPLVGCLSKLIYAQCVEFKDIIGMSANSVIHSKTSPSKKPRTSITSTIDHQITLTLIPLTRVGEATRIFPTKSPNSLPHHLSQNHPHPPDFQYQLLNFNLHLLYVKSSNFGEFNKEVRPNLNQDELGSR